MYFHSLTRASLILTSLAMLLLGSPVAAVPVLDQDNPLPGIASQRIGTISGSFITDVAQVFEVGIAGQLTSADVYMIQSGNPTADVTLDIRTTTAGVPDTGGILGSTTIGVGDISTSGDYAIFDLTAANVFVAVGDVFALVVSSTQDFVNNINEYLAYESNNSYAPGDFYHGDVDAGTATLRTRDIVFRTFVDANGTVPEPTTLALLGLGLAGLGFARRRLH